MATNLTYPEEVTAFLNETGKEYKDCIEKTFEADGSLYLVVCNQTVGHFDTFVSLRKDLFALAEKFSLGPFFHLSLWNEFKVIAFQIEIALMYKTVEIIAGCNGQIKQAIPESNPEKERIDLLKMAFQKITPDQIAEAVQFLTDRGWTNQRFMQEFRVDATTLWRYKTRKLHVQQSSQQLNGQSPDKVIEVAPTPN